MHSEYRELYKEMLEKLEELYEWKLDKMLNVYRQRHTGCEIFDMTDALKSCEAVVKHVRELWGSKPDEEMIWYCDRYLEDIHDISLVPLDSEWMMSDEFWELIGDMADLGECIKCLLRRDMLDGNYG